jgi:hypothetical protein
MCYVLRNTPLRLVRTSRVASDFQGSRNFRGSLQTPSRSPIAVSLADIEAYDSTWTRERLGSTPDDQLLFFWTEAACLKVAGPFQETITQRVSRSRGGSDSYKRRWFEIQDNAGNPIGSTAPCLADSQGDSGSVSGTSEFILIASNRPPESVPEKIVLQIERRDGVAYRVNIATIQETKWTEAAPKRALIALG